MSWSKAERYSKGVTESPFNFRGFHVPFLYSTDGEVIWHHDIRHQLNRSRQVSGFHTPEALVESLTRDFEDNCATLLATANDHPRIRPYLQEASTGIEKAIAERFKDVVYRYEYERAVREGSAAGSNPGCWWIAAEDSQISSFVPSATLFIQASLALAQKLRNVSCPGPAYPIARALAAPREPFWFWRNFECP
jgi:hypothetical protein